jgi:hypothetical protein
MIVFPIIRGRGVVTALAEIVLVSAADLVVIFILVVHLSFILHPSSLLPAIDRLLIIVIVLFVSLTDPIDATFLSSRHSLYLRLVSFAISAY